MDHRDIPDFIISEEQGAILVQLARHTITRRLGSTVAPAEDETLARQLSDDIFRQPRATFVTLHKAGALRGCMGTLSPGESLIDSIRHNAVNAAFHDPRFPPLAAEELAQVQIEISILTIPQPLPHETGDELLAALQPGIDGVILQFGAAGATFLPQVWEQLPRPEDFLNRLCLKAGLPADTWETGRLDVQTYQVRHFSE